MDFSFFFKSKMSHEEVASALLATFLARSPSFRAAFLRSVPQETLADVGLDRCLAAEWDVEVEKDSVDITLRARSLDLVVLVENKVRSGSRQVGQLRRYYVAQRDREPGTRVVALYLAPRSYGESEVNRVKSLGPALRTQDRAGFISWDDVCSLHESVHPGDPLKPAIEAALATIAEDIKNAAREKYPKTLERELVWNVMVEARALLQDRMLGRGQEVNLQIWTDRSFYSLYSARSDLGIFVDAHFATGPAPDHGPVGVVVGDGIHLRLAVGLSLSQKARTSGRSPELKAWWQELKRQAVLEVGDVVFHRDEKQRFVWSADLTLPREEMVGRIVDVADALLAEFAHRIRTGQSSYEGRDAHPLDGGAVLPGSR